mmetsp:Transcript_13559/g.41184  ORF Transcript_13559/g.41184 Transcript_13559/m.41184 type:complete len:218 (+) Transcript_13559:526-1179(+)
MHRRGSIGGLGSPIIAKVVLRIVVEFALHLIEKRLQCIRPLCEDADGGHSSRRWLAQYVGRPIPKKPHCLCEGTGCGCGGEQPHQQGVRARAVSRRDSKRTDDDGQCSDGQRRCKWVMGRSKREEERDPRESLEKVGDATSSRGGRLLHWNHSCFEDCDARCGENTKCADGCRREHKDFRIVAKVRDWREVAAEHTEEIAKCQALCRQQPNRVHRGA